jgi:DNA-binding ferritin-like protein
MRQQIDDLIVNLMVIQEFSKDIHYTCHGEGFYSKHLLVDKFDFSEDLDLLKECCLLGNGERPLASVEYLERAQEILMPPEDNNDLINFKNLNNMLYNALDLIDKIEGLSKADENVIGGIAQKLQQYKGLVNLQVV